jgi:hypothetical protein
MLNELYELSFRHEGRQTGFHRARMAADIKIYGTRIGRSMLGNEVENVVFKRRQEIFSAKFRFVGLVKSGGGVEPRVHTRAGED